MTIADALDKSYARLQHQLIRVAEEMPAENYSFRPSAEVRTFGEQLRHIGAVEWVIGSSIQGSAPPVDIGDGDSGPISMTAKTEILRYVRDSFPYIRNAVNTINLHNALDLIPHPYDQQNTKVERLVLAVGYACHAGITTAK